MSKEEELCILQQSMGELFKTNHRQIFQLIKEIKNPKKLRADGLLGRLAITLDYPNADDRKSAKSRYSF